MAITVYIGGVDQTEKVQGATIEWKLNARSTAALSMCSRDGSYRPTVGHEVVIYKGGSPIYGGSVDEFTEQRISPTPVLMFEVPVLGYERRLDKRVINQTHFGKQFFVTNSISDICTFSSGSTPFQNGDSVRVQSAGTLPSPLSAATTYYVVNRTSTTCQLATSVGGSPVNLLSDGTGDHWMLYTAGTAIKSIINFWGAFEGITPGTIEDGSGIEFTAEYARVMDVIDTLAQLSGKVSYITASKALNVVSRGSFAAPFNVSDSSSQVLTDPPMKMRHTREEYANAVYLQLNDAAFSPTLVNFTGDGSKKKFKLANPIKSIADDGVSVGGTPQTLGVYGVDTGKQWYYTPGDSWIVQDAGGTALTGAQTLSVFFRPYGLGHVFVEDTSEQSARASAEPGTSGKYDAPRQDDSIVTPEAGDTAAAAILEASKTIAIECRYSTYTAGLLPGQTQTINRPSMGVNASFLIDEVTARAVRSDELDLHYEVRALSTTRLGDYLSVFKSFVSGGSSSGAVSGGSGGGGGGGTGGQVYLHTVPTLSAPSTAITYAIQSSGLLVVVLTQDATGGRAVTWGADFHSSTPVDIDQRPNRRSTAFFFSDGTHWRILGGFEVE